MRCPPFPSGMTAACDPRHLVLRVYAVAAGGFLRRDARRADPRHLVARPLVVSMQHGGGSKDTWVLAEGPTPQFSLLRPASVPLEVSRATFDLPSRVADNLFWLGRYVERVEPAVRIARAILPRLYQDDPPGAAGLNAGHASALRDWATSAPTIGRREIRRPRWSARCWP